MTKIKGRYINLKESKVRRKQVEDQLEILGMNNFYSRFEAVRGSKEEAFERQLETGELGIWKSWIQLLKEEIEQDDHFDYLHIIEDDCILTKELYLVCKKLANLKNKNDLIMTDMYINPQIYRSIKKETGIEIDKKHINVLNGIYTGCLASTLIPKNKIEKIKELLEHEYDKSKRLIPIDNFLVRLQSQGRILIAVTLPFLTTVNEESILDSTIQKRNREEEAIRMTQQICYLLRKRLSTVDDKSHKSKITKAAIKLIRINTNQTNSDEDIMTDIIIQAIEGSHLKYRYRSILKGEPQNPQNE